MSALFDLNFIKIQLVVIKIIEVCKLKFKNTPEISKILKILYD